MMWLLIFGMAGVTYALRVVFLGGGAEQADGRWARWFRYVPASVLPALAASAVWGEPGPDDGRVPRLLAAAVAVGIAQLTKNTMATLCAGLFALWAVMTFWP